MTKTRRCTALVLAVVMCMCATASVALAISVDGNVAPRATIESVPSYQYVLLTTDDKTVRCDIVYKDVLVPTDCSLEVNGPTVKSTVFNDYFENVF